LLQTITNDEEWRLFKQLIRSQNLKPAGGSEKSLQHDPTGLVTVMLNHEANILKDRGGVKDIVLDSSGKVAKKSKVKNSPAGAVKDIECYGYHKRVTNALNALTGKMRVMGTRKSRLGLLLAWLPRMKPCGWPGILSGGVYYGRLVRR